MIRGGTARHLSTATGSSMSASSIKLHGGGPDGRRVWGRTSTKRWVIIQKPAPHPGNNQNPFRISSRPASPTRADLTRLDVDLEGVGWHISSQSLLAAICRRDELANAQGNERTGYFENLIGDR